MAEDRRAFRAKLTRQSGIFEFKANLVHSCPGKETGGWGGGGEGGRGGGGEKAASLAVGVCRQLHGRKGGSFRER